VYTKPRVLTAGEAGLVVEFSDRVDHRANLAARLLDRLLAEALEEQRVPPRAIRGTVVTYRSLLVLFEPLCVRHGPFRALVTDLAGRAADEARRPDHTAVVRGRLWEIPVCYEDDLAPDLSDVAELTGLGTAEVVRLHCDTEYLVYMLGFQIGYPYLASLPPQLRVPRLAKPRLKTPEGAVAIAGELTGIYSLASPGGWRVLGTTPVPLWDLSWASPTLLEAGDRVRFVPVDRAEFGRMRQTRYLPPGFAAAQEARRQTGRGAGERTEEADLAGDPALHVIHPGLLTTVQDLGRPGYWRYGLGPGGAMDRFALRVGNRLLGQAETAAALEVTAGGVSFAASRDVSCVWASPGGQLRVAGRRMPAWTVVRAAAGQTIEVDWFADGARGYLCLGGGLAVPRVLGSRSTNLAARFGGLDGRTLRAGDLLATCLRVSEAAAESDLRHREGRRADPAVIGALYGRLADDPVRLGLVAGPQDSAFAQSVWQELLASPYRVANESNRMGYRLEGPRVRALTDGGHDIVSDGLTEGAVQVPGNGQPVLLMADHQTTGGYPKIGVVPAADLPIAAQIRPGRRVGFVATQVKTALDRRLEIEEAVAAAAGELRRVDLTFAGHRYEIGVDEPPR